MRKVVIIAVGVALLFAVEVGYSLALRAYALPSSGQAFFQGPVTQAIAEALGRTGSESVARAPASARPERGRGQTAGPASMASPAGADPLPLSTRRPAPPLPASGSGAPSPDAGSRAPGAASASAVHPALARPGGPAMTLAAPRGGDGLQILGATTRGVVARPLTPP